MWSVWLYANFWIRQINGFIYSDVLWGRDVMLHIKIYHLLTRQENSMTFSTVPGWWEMVLVIPVDMYYTESDPDYCQPSQVEQIISIIFHLINYDMNSTKHNEIEKKKSCQVWKDSWVRPSWNIRAWTAYSYENNIHSDFSVFLLLHCCCFLHHVA